MYGPAGGYRPAPPSQGTAKTLLLVAFVLQLLLSLIYIVVGLLGIVAGSLFLFVGSFGVAILALSAIATIAPILVLYVAYRYAYAPTRDGNFAAARGPTLLLGIVGIFFGVILVGLLYLLAYWKIGQAQAESGPQGGWAGAPTPAFAYAPSPVYGRPGSPTTGGVAYAPGPSASLPSTCPRCGRMATYIPQYGRSYCYACTQYV
ncbi:MAG: hypothetical protein L3K16_02325 [Thermoplasmata archaeon]|nr:hypothetical protein [Thermoplasmata archaeon]